MFAKILKGGYGSGRHSGGHMMQGVGGYRDPDHRGLSSELAHEDAENARSKAQMPSKLYHKVPFAQKDKAKAEGMKFDGDKKLWYHTNTVHSVGSSFPRHHLLSIER
jgi:hypothetical protein